MKQYHDLLNHIIKYGVEKEDRTGTGTLSVFGYQMRFDLNAGFPILTTKKVYWHGVVEELLWFLRGETNIKSLVEKNVHIWDAWMKKEDNIGGASSKRPIILVKKIIKDYVPGPDILPSTDGLDVERGSIDDKLRGVWRHMMLRCYNPEHHNFKWYGGNNICVAKEWHNVAKFIEDVKKLPNWEHKKNNWNEFKLDKDYFSSNIYSPETCVWLSSQENIYYTRMFKPFCVSIPGEAPVVFLTLSHGEEVLDISKSTLQRLLSSEQSPETLKGNNKKAHSWKFEWIPERQNEALRMAFSMGELGPIYGAQWRNWGGIGIDQIANVINQIKTNPDSRRLIVNSWNVAEVDKMALPPCHMFFQFYVANGKLSCQLYQRSADVFLGVPFNIASYALLTHMIAQVCNLGVGEFIHTLGDAHIYRSHFQQVDEQLKRKPLDLPKLVLNASINDIDKFSSDDIQLENYQHHPAIKAPVSI